MRARILIFALGALLALAACGTSKTAGSTHVPQPSAAVSSFASAHPSAAASASKAIQRFRHSRHARANLQAALNCLPNATSLSGVRACERATFPKGGASKAFRCALTQAITHLYQGRAAIRAAILAACSGIR